MKRFNKSLLALALGGVLAVTGCSDGDDGRDGAPGEPGAPGAPGLPGLPGGTTATTVESAAELLLVFDPADVVITSGDAFSARFTAMTADGRYFTGLDKVRITMVQQDEDDNGRAFWNSNTDGKYNKMYATPSGKANYWGSEIDAGTLVEDPMSPGSYRITWEHDGEPSIMVADGEAVTRIMLQAYNITTAAGDRLDNNVASQATFFPATGLPVAAEEIMMDQVSTQACAACHTDVAMEDGSVGMYNIKAHSYYKVEECVMCHNGGEGMAHLDEENLAGEEPKGFNGNLGPMVHRLHHNDGLVGEAEHEWHHIGYPQRITECETCHAPDATAWKLASTEACESCHQDFRNNADLELDHAAFGDDACAMCHAEDSTLGPIKAHRVSDTATGGEAVSLIFDSAELDDAGLLTVTYTVADATGPMAGMDFADYYAILEVKPELTMTEVMDNGIANHHEHAALGLMGVVSDADGKLVVTLPDMAGWDGKTALFAPHFAVCTMDGVMVANEVPEMTVFGPQRTPVCPEGAIQSPVKMAVDVALIGGEAGDVANELQMNADTMTASTEKCNACHDDLSLPKKGYGNTDLAQCAQCHNPYFSGSYHNEVNEFVTNAAGEVEMVTTLGEYANRDLFTVTHRFHSGAWDPAGAHGVFRLDGKLKGYSAKLNDCGACHQDNATLFAADGSLTSGKREIEIEYPVFSGAKYKITPVAETCRSCHQHNTDAAEAHFKANGAILADDLNSAEITGVESCGVCHAEGKTYGIDKMHAGQF